MLIHTPSKGRSLRAYKLEVSTIADHHRDHNMKRKSMKYKRKQMLPIVASPRMEQFQITQRFV